MCVSDGAVHPHVCGEHPYGMDAMTARDGSSPRMWGTRCGGDVRVYGGRFIPTYVGNTQFNVMLTISSTVHPHVCGEHSRQRLYACIQFGSSPRMWGTLRKDLPQ